MAGGVANRPYQVWSPASQSYYHPSPSEIHRLLKNGQIEKAVKVIESKALWCDQGQHAFSSKDKAKRRSVEERETLNRYDEPVTEQEEFYTCGPCADKVRVATQEVAKKTAELEAWNDGFNEGAKTQGGGGSMVEPPF